MKRHLILVFFFCAAAVFVQSHAEARTKSETKNVFRVQPSLQNHDGQIEKHAHAEDDEDDEEDDEDDEDDEDEDDEDEDEDEDEDDDDDDDEDDDDFVKSFMLTIECRADTDEILLADLKFTPCLELQEEMQEKCAVDKPCTLTGFRTKRCVDYTTQNPEQIYECIQKIEESLLQLPTIHFSPFMRFFSSSIDTCIEAAKGLTLVQILVGTLDRSARYFGEFNPPSIMEKRLYRGFGEELRLKNWQQVYISAKRLGIRPCRISHNSYDLLLFLPPEDASRYSGPIMAFRLDSPSAIIQYASRHDLRLDNFKYQMEIFANSDVQALVFQPYSPYSSLERDVCQPKYRITEGTHSMEAPIFHLFVGLADAFKASVFLESQECNRCVGIIGRGMPSREAATDSYIMQFAGFVNDLFNPNRSFSPKQRTWSIDLNEELIADNIYKVSEPGLGAFESVHSVLGRYLHNVSDICDLARSVATTDSNRYLSIQRESRSLRAVQSKISWENMVTLLDMLADSQFMSNRLQQWGSATAIEDVAPYIAHPKERLHHLRGF